MAHPLRVQFGDHTEYAKVVQTSYASQRPYPEQKRVIDPVTRRACNLQP